jgi:hypothetical protein
MLREAREAFLKHDLYRIILPPEAWDGAYKLEDLPVPTHKKVASKGARFVYCETDRKDAGMGWFADAGNGNYRAGNCGFGKMGGAWAKEHLTEPVDIVGTRFRNQW